nr:DsrE family protein [Chromobacterium sp. ASV5]
MQNILITVNSSPYGSERTLSALRLALTLSSRPERCKVKLFLLSDATVTAMKQQQTGAVSSLGEMLREVLVNGGIAKVCRTCADARGINEQHLLEGVGIGTMPELADWTLEADKVVSF